MIAVCLKWSSADDDDARFAGVSPADQAALELALLAGQTWGVDVLAVTAGPAVADRALRDALACGAQRALRLDLDAATDSRDVGAALADATSGARLVVCGDHSLDRGSGSVPAYIAHHRRVAQALGLVSIDLSVSTSDTLRAVRRLDGGRREVLSIPVPCVVSVESSVASLRRASLRRALASETATIESLRPTIIRRVTPPAVIAPYRPRARILQGPSGTDALARVRQLTDAGTTSAHGEVVELPPRAAAARIVLALQQWGYLS
jgi:electron transfer flavoprotein beta subunit